MENHSICHIEFSVTDLEKSEAFYGGLFEWKFERWGENYSMFTTPNEPGGALMKDEKVNPGQSPVIYILVDDIEPYLEKARELGGNVCHPTSEIPNVGWFAIISDPDKNVVGLFKGLPKEG